MLQKFDGKEQMKLCGNVLGAIAVFLCVNAASADPVTYDFTVTPTSGPAMGLVQSGYFTYDSSLIPPGGGSVMGANLLTDLAFNWVGTLYDETTANTGQLEFNPDGSLSSATFGINCYFSPPCAGTVSPWLVGGSRFFYSPPNSGLLYGGDVSYAVRPMQVPEPGSLALVSIGLAGLAVARRRKSN